MQRFSGTLDGRVFPLRLVFSMVGCSVPDDEQVIDTGGLFVRFAASMKAGEADK